MIVQRKWSILRGAQVRAPQDDGEFVVASHSTHLALVADCAEVLVDAEHDQDEFRGDT